MLRGPGAASPNKTACLKLGHGLLEVLPSVPPGQAVVSGTNIRVGDGSVDVAARHEGASWTTTVTARLACTLHAGAYPAGRHADPPGDAQRFSGALHRA